MTTPVHRETGEGTADAPRRILYVIDALARGGTELQLTGLIDRLDRTRWQPHLCTLRPSDRGLLPADCPHLEWDVPRLLAPGGMAAVWRLARFLRRGRFAAVQTFFQDATAFGGVAARLAGTPVRLASFRDMGFWRTRRQELMLRRVYPLMTGFIANAGVVRDHFCVRDGIDPARVQVIPNGVDLAGLPWREHAGPTRHVGIVGNLNRRVKRTDLFLRAAGRVARDHPAVTWHVVGDGEFRPEYEQLARAEGLDGRVVFPAASTMSRDTCASSRSGSCARIPKVSATRCWSTCYAVACPWRRGSGEILRPSPMREPGCWCRWGMSRPLPGP